MKAEITHHRFDNGVHAFDYTLHRKPRLKHRYIRIRNGEVILSAHRRTTPSDIEAFVTQQAGWIIRHLSKQAREPVWDLTHPNTQFHWLGQTYRITITHGSRDQLTLEEGTAHFVLSSDPTHADMLTLIHRYYKAHAETVLLPKVHSWASRMQLQPTRVGFRRARTRWGSCSARDSLSLNTFLLMLPDDVIDYVIVHELAHIRHKNHGKNFWNLVEKYLPEWKKQRKSIRNYEKFLI